MQLLNFTEILFLVTFLLFVVITFFILKTREIQNNLSKELIQNVRNLKVNSEELKKVTISLNEQPKKMSSFDTEHVLGEIRKISDLWKSRREKLSRGMWEKFEMGTEESEVKLDDEKSKLQKEKERIEELMKKTKIKYRTREIDEQAFRDIMKDYQKELMEITLKLSELR